MKTAGIVYLVTAQLAQVDGEGVVTRGFACEAVPDCDALVAHAHHHGFVADIKVERVEVETSITTWFQEWIARLVGPELNDFPPTMPNDPESPRLNEVERAVRNQDRKIDNVMTAIGQLTALVTRLAPTVPAPAAPLVCAEHGNDFRAKCASCARAMGSDGTVAIEVVPDDKARGRDPRRSARRMATPEFNSNPEHDSNSMGLVGPSASPPMKGQRGGTVIIGTSIDADGNPAIVEQAPTTVGDSMRRGNLHG